MPPDPTEPQRVERLIDRFSTRAAFMSCMLLLLLTCFVAGNYVQATVKQLRSTTRVFDERQLRNGYVAMSDIQRLNLVVQEAASQGFASPKNKSDFQSAADFLYVRTNHFANVQAAGADLASAGEAIIHLNEILALSDEAIANDFVDLTGLSITLPVKSQEARQALVKFLDEMRRMMDSVLSDQNRAVEKQRNVVWATLAGLTVFGWCALLLLRREVVSRQGKRIAEERVRHLAFFDPLTGLPNRVQFQDKLSDLLWKEKPLALLLIDLDNFKQINDTYGHIAGDAVLKEVSKRLAGVASILDGFAARLGGDEFSVFFQTDDKTDLTKICTDVMAAIGHKMMFEGEELSIGVSVGLATTAQIPKGMHLSLDSLSRITDFALYASKTDGRKRFTIYNTELETVFLERRAMVEELPQAIKNGDMDFFLQPKVTLETERVFGFEALARWRRNGEIVPPHLFIETAEESGLITEIDKYIFRQACRTIVAYNAENGTNFSISVNFSALHFNALNFVGFIADTLAETRLPSELLTLEITETVELRDLAKATSIINGIQELGVKIAIDDFGAGFSSLAYLRTTNADEVKIDRSLVSDIETSASSLFLLDSIVGIANRLDFDVIIEGVETSQQAEFARKTSASSAQGYYFGRPAPKHQALDAAKQHNEQGLRSVTAAE